MIACKEIMGKRKARTTSIRVARTGCTPTGAASCKAPSPRICSSASLLSGEGRHGRGTDELAGGARLRRNRTPRPVVGNSVGGVLGVVSVHRLLDLGRVSG